MTEMPAFNQIAISFDKIHEDYLARGIDLYDVHRSHGSSLGDGHFEAWHKKKGLPEHDEEGKHYRSSKIFFRQYKEDKDGQIKAPLFVNVWHYLLKVSEILEWTTTEDKHTKKMPLFEALLSIPKEPTEEQLSKYGEKLRQIPNIPEDVVEEQIRSVTRNHLETIEARKILIDIINEYGVSDEDLGKLLIIEMTVSR